MSWILALALLHAAPGQAHRPVVGVVLRPDSTTRIDDPIQARNGLADALEEAEPGIEWIVVLHESELANQKLDASANIVVEEKRREVPREGRGNETRTEHFNVVSIESNGRIATRESTTKRSGFTPFNLGVLGTGFCLFCCPPAAAVPWTGLSIAASIATGSWGRGGDVLGPLKVFGMLAFGWPFLCVSKAPLLWPCTGKDMFFSGFEDYFDTRDAARPVLPRLLDDAGLTPEALRNKPPEAI